MSHSCYNDNNDNNANDNNMELSEANAGNSGEQFFYFSGKYRLLFGTVSKSPADVWLSLPPFRKLSIDYRLINV